MNESQCFTALTFLVTKSYANANKIGSDRVCTMWRHVNQLKKLH